MPESYRIGNIPSSKKVTILGSYKDYQNGDYVRMENRLREIRKSLGLSGEKLAEIAGTTKVTISRLEKGDRRLSDHWIERIVTGLHKAGHKHITPADFFEEDRITAKLSKVPPKDRARLQKIYDNLMTSFEETIDTYIEEKK